MKLFLQTYNKGELKEMTIKELIAHYKATRKQKLVLAYQLSNDVLEYECKLKSLIDRKVKELEHMAAQAQYDRENADGLAYNEVVLSLN